MPANTTTILRKHDAELLRLLDIAAVGIDAGEIWPAMYEHAYAKWRTNEPGDDLQGVPILHPWGDDE